MNVITNIRVGSHLYGTNIETSDMDYKGVYLSSKEDILLQRVKDSINLSTKKSFSQKNTSDDTDLEFYSLHKFLKMACDGETVAIDMLHAPVSCIKVSSPVWASLCEKRKMFYTKNMSAFIGYSRSQASKYCVKGERLRTVQQVVAFANANDENKILSAVWDDLPITDHTIKHVASSNHNNLRLYEFCSRKLPETVTIGHLREVARALHEKYGQRTITTANMQGSDWKAVGHALRVLYEVRHILIENDLVFPLVEAPFLKAVRLGHLNYGKEVQPLYEGLLLEVEDLLSKSTLPEKCDQGYWDKFIIDVIESTYR